MDKRQVNMSTMISRSISFVALLLNGIYSYQVQAKECYFDKINTSTVSAGTLVVNNYNPSSTTPVLLGTLSAGEYGHITCNTGNDGSDFMEDPQQQAVRNTIVIPAPVVVQNIATTEFFSNEHT